MQLLANTLKTHGPFDGALCFSQGGIFLRHAHRIMFDVDRAAYHDAADAFPKFAICVASMYSRHLLSIPAPFSCCAYCILHRVTLPSACTPRICSYSTTARASAKRRRSAVAAPYFCAALCC